MTATQALAIASLFCATATAQVTNLVMAHPDFREVDGQLYNIQRSVKWRTVKGAFISSPSEGLVIGREFEIKKHGHLGASSDPLARIGGGFGSPAPWILDRVETNWGSYFILKNYEGPRQIQVRALPVARTNILGEQATIYDCGTHHLAPVVSKPK